MPFELIGPYSKKEKRSTFSPLGGRGGGHCYHTLSLSNFRAKTQLKISLK